MTNGQIQQLRDLSKCHMTRRDAALLGWFTFDWEGGTAMDKSYIFDAEDKAWLRRLTHQYRNQIRAIRRNQRRAA